MTIESYQPINKSRSLRQCNIKKRLGRIATHEVVNYFAPVRAKRQNGGEVVSKSGQ